MIKKNFKVVMVFGAFDGLHTGHLDFFRQARKHGDFLLVSVGTDKNVERIKGKMALFSQEERLDLVEACRFVDKAVMGAEENFWEHIGKFSPDVVCLGYDQWADEGEVRSELGKIGLKNTRVVRLKGYEVDRAKSTITKKKSVDF